MQQLCVLGSTGSIGISTLDVVARNSDRYRVRSLVAGRNRALMLEQVRQFKPEYAVMADPAAADALRDRVKAEGLSTTEVLGGTRSVARMAADCSVDVVMAAIVGFCWSAANTGCGESWQESAAGKQGNSGDDRCPVYGFRQGIGGAVTTD